MNRPTHIGIECRLTIEEAEALEKNLATFASMIRQRVCFARTPQLEPALMSGLEKLQKEIAMRNEPFDPIIAGVQMAGGVR